MFYGNHFVTGNVKSQKFTRYHCSASTIEVNKKQIWISHCSWNGLLGQDPEECSVFSQSRFPKIGHFKRFQMHISASACNAQVDIFDDLAPYDLYYFIWIKISTSGSSWQVVISTMKNPKFWGWVKKIPQNFMTAFNLSTDQVLSPGFRNNAQKLRDSRIDCVM